VVVLETTMEKLDYQRFFNLAREIRKGIKSQVFFPRQNFMCKDCEYSGVCQTWRGE
jgi:CRISPR/Cas system-associated exonuclease Cas4 (RecB family)